jgi:SAM-dependent methyltransferase
MSKETVVDQVREKYAAVAASKLSSQHEGVRAVAEAFGYTPEDLAAIPAEANMGLSCGNPTAFASLRPGETVVDLGCGGGLDVLLAAPKVGPAGKAIGIDMTAEMIERARQNAAKLGLKNVEFHLATIDRLPLPDESVDCVISNCVINLAPDKPAVFREIFRVLKPGGRVAVSDIALKKPLPDEVGKSLLAYVGCIAGAIAIPEYERGLADAGFGGVQIVDTGKDLNAYSKVENQAGCCAPVPAVPATTASSASPCCTPAPSGSGVCCTPNEDAEPVTAGCCSPASNDVHGGLAELLRKYDVNDYAASVQVYAVKGR